MSTPSNPNANPVWKRFIAVASLSRVQAIVGTLAGVASIAAAAFPLLQSVRPQSTGRLVAVVEAAGSRRSVADATIEVLTADNAIVATLKPDAAGRATQELKEGVYVVRVSHPRYAAEVRRVQLQPQQTVEVRTSLSEVRPSVRAGSSPSSSHVERAVTEGVSAVRKALRF